MGKRFYKPPRMVDYRVVLSSHFFGGFLFMNEKLMLELFGYLGTALVLLSFVMRDIKWLRVINMAGGFISLIYAICVNTMPVVVLNGSVILINAVQLIRLLREERKNAETVNNDDSGAYDEKENDKEETI